MTERFEKLEAADELIEDYRVLAAEALSHARSMGVMIDQTRQALQRAIERGKANENALTVSLGRMRQQRALWEQRADVYAHRVRAVLRKRAAMEAP